MRRAGRDLEQIASYKALNDKALTETKSRLERVQVCMYSRSAALRWAAAMQLDGQRTIPRLAWPVIMQSQPHHGVSMTPRYTLRSRMMT